MRITINENEKDQISSQHEEIDRSLFNILLRRINTKEKNFSTYWLGDKPLRVTLYTFEGFPGFGFTELMSKKDMEKQIIEMLYENDIIEHIYDMDEKDPKRVKIIKTVRNFLKFLLSDEK